MYLAHLGLLHVILINAYVVNHFTCRNSYIGRSSFCRNFLFGQAEVHPVKFCGDGCAPLRLLRPFVHKRWKKQGEQDGVRRTLPCRDRRSPDPSALGGRWEGCGENSCDLAEFSVTGGGCNGTISMTQIPTAQNNTKRDGGGKFRA